MPETVGSGFTSIVVSLTITINLKCLYNFHLQLKMWRQSKEKLRNLLNKYVIKTGLPTSPPGGRAAQCVMLRPEVYAASCKAPDDRGTAVPPFAH